MKEQETDYLLITALHAERDAVLKLFDFKKNQAESFVYYQTETGFDNKIKLALTMLSGMGNIESGVHVANVINTLHPKHIFMVGIAGGFEGRVNLGDVLVGTEIIYYEQSKNRDTENQIRPQVIQSDSVLQSRAQNISLTDWSIGIEEKLSIPLNSKLKPKVHFGPIACGEKVVATKSMVSKLQNLHPKLLGVEMESYGVARAASFHAQRPRFIAIRSVCDFANSEKNDDYHEYAAQAAACYAKALIMADQTILSDKTELSESIFLSIKHMSMEIIPSPVINTDAQVIEILIDQSDLFEDKRMTNPILAIERQSQVIQEIKAVIENAKSFQLGYSGIAHIPFVFMLGYELKLRQKIDFFEHNRINNTWNLFPSNKDFPNLILEGFPLEIENFTEEVILKFSVSYPIVDIDVLEVVSSVPVMISLGLRPPVLDSVQSIEQLENYALFFRKVLDDIHNKFPKIKKIHLFYAGPVPLAFRCGELISSTIHPMIRIYNYTNHDSPKYKWSVCVNTPVNSTDFLVQY